MPKKLILLCAALAVCLGLSECAFRAYAGGQYEAALEKYRENPDVFVQVVRDDPVQFVLIPGNQREMLIPATDASAEVRWSFAVNEDGFRGGPLDLAPGTEQIRVLMIGDSYAFGLGVDDDETLPHQLERMLNAEDAGRRFRVINGGVPGTNSVQHEHLLRRAIDKIEPHLVLLLFVMNDAEPLHGVPNPPSYVYRHYSLWVLAEARDAINRLFGSELFEITKPVDKSDYLSSFLPDSHQWRESKRAVRQMAEMSREHQSMFAVFIYPDMTRALTLDYGYLLIHESVKQWGAQDGYPVMDLFPSFFGKSNEDLAVHGDGHPNAKAHAIAASVIADYLRMAFRH